MGVLGWMNPERIFTWRVLRVSCWERQVGGNGCVRTVFRTGLTSDNIVNQGIGSMYRSHSSSLTPRTVPSTMNPVFPLRTGCQLITLEPHCVCSTCSTTCLGYSAARKLEPLLTLPALDLLPMHDFLHYVFQVALLEAQTLVP